MSRKKQPPNKYDVLRKLIVEYVNAAIDDSWKGGEDPTDIPVKEARLEWARARVNAHLEKMEMDIA